MSCPGSVALRLGTAEFHDLELGDAQQTIG